MDDEEYWDAQISKAEDHAAEQMRERCAKVDPLSVPCGYCLSQAGEMCLQDEQIGAHHIRWAAAVRALPPREPSDE